LSTAEIVPSAARRRTAPLAVSAAVPMVSSILQKLVLTSVFVVLPLMLLELDFVSHDHWQLYFPTLMLSFFLMVPLIIIGAFVKK